MAWKTMSILCTLFCTSAFAMPFGKTPFGELIHSRSVAANIVVHVDMSIKEKRRRCTLDFGNTLMRNAPERDV
jgi:hypothetical protein